MIDEQSRDQLLSCLEDVKLDLEEIKQHSSAVMVGQAIEMIEEYASKLDHYRMAAEAESQEVDKLNAELDEYKGHCKALFENLNDATSRLGTALTALRNIDRMDPRYDANEVHHEARLGQGFSWDAHRQVWLNETGEDLVKGRDYGRVVENQLTIGCSKCGKTLPSVEAFHADDCSICPECAGVSERQEKNGG